MSEFTNDDRKIIVSLLRKEWARLDTIRSSEALTGAEEEDIISRQNRLNEIRWKVKEA